MTRLILPAMVEKKRGYVINLGSFSGDVPVPLLSTYSASKAFVEFFSETIQQEYLRDGIIVKCATPMFVATEMAKNATQSHCSDTFKGCARHPWTNGAWLRYFQSLLGTLFDEQMSHKPSRLLPYSFYVQNQP